jgi:short-subunit dehydrogenase
VEVIVADLADSDGLSQVEARLGESGGVDLLVNNAGFGTRGLFASLPVDEEEREIRVNVLAAVRLSRAALPAMVEAGHGDIVNVSSVASIQPIPYWATYSATKAYLTSFSLSVHEEVKRSGVNVMALLPGFTRTEFQRRKNLDVPAIPDPLWMSSEQVVRKALRAVMRGRALCVPGTRYRLITSLSRVTPWSVSRRLLRAGGVQMNRTEGR